MDSVTKRLQSLWNYPSIFTSPADAWRYARLRLNHASGKRSAEPAFLRVRPLGGLPLLCRPTRDVWTFKSTFLGGFHRPPVTLPENAIILDLGCNVGYTVADLAWRHRSARVIGVEMDPTNLEIARQNTAAFGARVQLLHAAAWIHDGEVSYSGAHVDGYRIDPDASAAGSMTAPAKRIVTIMDEFDVERVDYLKMDVEGAEAELFGDADWLDRVVALKVETHPPATPAFLIGVLTGRGFDCRLDDRHRRAISAFRTLAGGLGVGPCAG